MKDGCAERILQIAVAYFAVIFIVTPLAAEDVSVPVTTKSLADLVFFPLRDAPATVISLNDTRVRSQINGVIKKIDVRVGDSVKEGDIVADLDCRDYRLAVIQAESTYKSAQATKKFDASQLLKAKKLQENNAISNEEIDRRISSDMTSTAELERSKAALEIAQHSVQKCSIKAPFNAVVIERIASLGDYVEPGTPIVRLLDQDDIEISAKIQEQDLEDLKKASDPVFVSHNQRFPVALRTILPLMDSRLRSYETRLTFSQERAAVGAAGRLEWRLPVGRIPSDLLVRRKESLGIFIAAGERAQFVPLAGAMEGQPAVAELAPDTKIIISGRFNIRDRDLIQIIQP